MLGRAATLHDVGKIGISDAILLKPGRLTADEYDAIKQHAEIGHLILDGSHSPLLRLAAEIALGHHERWDGTGYPRRLARDEIPLSARTSSTRSSTPARTKTRWTSTRLCKRSIESAARSSIPASFRRS
jgi:putative two-component system response regulator